LIYSYIDSSWHGLVQIAFWAIIGLLIFIRKNSSINNFIFNNVTCLSGEIKNNLSKFVYVFLILIGFISYFLLLRNIPYSEIITRYPPLMKFLYYSLYSAFGITHVGPRMLQLVFYILGAVYLYRIIILFSNKESALIGATVYLFFPIMFAYAKLAEAGCGTVFFVILISFHFLRFLEQRDDRDLILTAFFIGIGFMYKRAVFVMFFICTLYLIAKTIKSKDLHYIAHLKVMLLALVPIIPLMTIGKFFIWRNYKIIWSNLRPFDGKAFTFFLNFPRDISWILFSLFLFAIVYILFIKRSTLSQYFGLLFLAYYSFLVLDIGNYSPRLYMPLYPAIAVYLSLFIYDVIERIKWKHSFKLAYSVISIYLIIICTVPSINAQFIADNEMQKFKYFPDDAAMQWVKENVNEGEKVLTLRIMSSLFYTYKYGIDRKKIDDLWYEITAVSTPEKLIKYYKDNKISYVMFPSFSSEKKILKYLKENRNEEFIEVTRFNRDDNYIYIYRLKDS